MFIKLRLENKSTAISSLHVRLKAYKNIHSYKNDVFTGGVIFSVAHTDISLTTRLSSVCVHAVSYLTQTYCRRQLSWQVPWQLMAAFYVDYTACSLYKQPGYDTGSSLATLKIAS